jgi:predicted amino acid racemase
MAFIKLYREKLQHNYKVLDELFKDNNIEWGVVSKILCGNKTFLKELIALGPTEIFDSRVSNLKIVKQLNPEIQTIYIKPPPKRIIPNVVRHADVSFNTEYDTIKRLSDEAVKQEKTHKIIIMIEMGDLREGVMGDDLLMFYKEVFELPNIQVVGIGANLNCLNGVMPSEDKLIQLGLYKQLIEAKFNVKIPWVSGGTSVTIPLVHRRLIPKGINHFRIGEALFFGKDLFTGGVFPGMHYDVFELFAEIIELSEKPLLPSGELGKNVAGDTFEMDEELYGKTTHRAIIDVGLLDIDTDQLRPRYGDLDLAGASSDMMVIDLGDNEANLKVGDLMRFQLDYMGALKLLNSSYINKLVEE